MGADNHLIMVIPEHIRMQKLCQIQYKIAGPFRVEPAVWLVQEQYTGIALTVLVGRNSVVQRGVQVQVLISCSIRVFESKP